jgi:hypothetical protein
MVISGVLPERVPTSELLREVTRNGGYVIVLDDGQPHSKLP